jgi:DNA modification methylase
MKKQNFTWVEKGKLTPNDIAPKLYGAFSLSNIDDLQLLENINDFGNAIEPLIITKDYVVISGTRRLAAARSIESVKKLPCIIKSDLTKEDITEFLIISHNLTRVKDVVTIAFEHHTLSKKYNLRQGVKGEPVKEVLKLRQSLVESSEYSDSTIKRVLACVRSYSEINDCEEKESWDFVCNEVVKKKRGVDNVLKSLMELVHKKRNKQIVSELKVSPIEDTFRVYRQSSIDISNVIEAGQIDCIVTSPPFPNAMRLYVQNDDDTSSQLGQEDTIEKYIDNLMPFLKQCIYALKETGTFWLNIYDPIIDGEEIGVSDEIIARMKSLGMKFIARNIWFKSNPPFNNSKRPINNKEYILQFAKNTHSYKWRDDWYESSGSFFHDLFYGSEDKKRVLKCVIIPHPNSSRENVWGGIETNVNNSAMISKLLKKHNLHLSHNAMYPMEIPLVCILSTSDKNDNAMDIFHGLGTTGIVAHVTERVYHGFEVSDEYATMSILRFNEFMEMYPANKK